MTMTEHTLQGYRAVKHVHPDEWFLEVFVPASKHPDCPKYDHCGQGCPGPYSVMVSEKPTTCSCPSYEYRGWCRHVRLVEEMLRPKEDKS